MTFSPALAAGKPVQLFEGPYTPDVVGHQRYDVDAAGNFLMVENNDAFRAVLVQGWEREVARLVSAARR